MESSIQVLSGWSQKLHTTAEPFTVYKLAHSTSSSLRLQVQAPHKGCSLAKIGVFQLSIKYCTFLVAPCSRLRLTGKCTTYVADGIPLGKVSRGIFPLIASKPPFAACQKYIFLFHRAGVVPCPTDHLRASWLQGTYHRSVSGSNLSKPWLGYRINKGSMWEGDEKWAMVYPLEAHNVCSGSSYHLFHQPGSQLGCGKT